MKRSRLRRPEIAARRMSRREQHAHMDRKLSMRCRVAHFSRRYIASKSAYDMPYDIFSECRGLSGSVRICRNLAALFPDHSSA
jgi:hypothetical protein